MQCISSMTIDMSVPLCLCVEPVLGSILDTEVALHALARLGRYTTGSVDTVHLLVVTIEVHKLEPGHTAEVIGAIAGRLRSSHLAGDVDVDLAEVDAIGLQIEEWDALFCELVVARQAVVCKWASRNVVLEGDLSDRSEDCGSSYAVASRVEQRCYGAHSLGCLSRCSGCAGVILHASTNSDMGKL